MLKRAHRELAKNAIYTEVMPTGEDSMTQLKTLMALDSSDSDSDSDSSSDDNNNIKKKNVFNKNKSKDSDGDDDSESDIDSDEEFEIMAHIQKYESSLKKDKKKKKKNDDDDDDDDDGESVDEDEDDSESKEEGSSDEEGENSSEGEETEENTHFRCKICPKKILKNETMVQVHLKGHEHKANLRLYKKALKEERTKEEIERLKTRNQKKREKSLKKKDERKAAKKQKLKEKKKRQWENKMAAAATEGSTLTKDDKKETKEIPGKSGKKAEPIVKKVGDQVRTQAERTVAKVEKTVEKGQMQQKTPPQTTKEYKGKPLVKKHKIAQA